MSYYMNENRMKLTDNIITIGYTQKKMVKCTAYNRKTSCLFHYAYVSRRTCYMDKK